MQDAYDYGQVGDSPKAPAVIWTAQFELGAPSPTTPKPRGTYRAVLWTDCDSAGLSVFVTFERLSIDAMNGPCWEHVAGWDLDQDLDNFKLRSELLERVVVALVRHGLPQLGPVVTPNPNEEE